MASTVAMVPPGQLLCVTFDYTDGRKLSFEGPSLQLWLQQYLNGQEALTILLERAQQVLNDETSSGASDDEQQVLSLSEARRKKELETN